MTRARDLASLGDNSSKLEQQGLVKIIPSSVAVGSGTGSANALGTVTFSGASSVSLNDVFSSTYDNYRIVYEITNCTVDGALAIRMRTGGTDASGANTYLFSGVNYNTSGTANAYYSSGSTRVDLTDLDGGGSTANVAVYAGVIDLHNPNLSEYTVGNAVMAGSDTGGTYRSHYGNFWHVVESPYTGFTFFHISSGTITGKVSVYGYN